MKKIAILPSLLLIAMLLSGCGFTINGKDFDLIEPSGTIITKDFQVSGFNAIEFSTFGEVILTQGETESLNLKGSDNLVPLVEVTVQDGVLKIDMDVKIGTTHITPENTLIFTITVKDLERISITGAGKLEMDGLATRDLAITMSGAGQLSLEDLSAESVDVTLSGLGEVKIAGEASSGKFSLPGAGNLDCSDLKLQSATVNISGLGNATLWVTDQLTGTISGAGNVSYYGSPAATTSSSGIGKFTPLGDK